MSELPYILVLYFSRFGATEEMAHYIAQGIEQDKQCTAKLRTVKPIAEEPWKDNTLVTMDDLSNAAGIAFGSPTRFGNMAAPLKHFWDGTSRLWMNGALVSKPFSVFTATSSMHGGQESTLFSMAIPLLHHGMLWVGTPYTEAALSQTKTGGTPYGPSHVAGVDQKNPISTEERQLCLATGKRLAQVAMKLLSSPLS